MLDSTIASVNSALKRARAGGQRQRPSTDADERSATSSSETEIVARFVRAYEAADLDAVVSLLTDDAFMSMPPLPTSAGAPDSLFSHSPAIASPP